MVDSLVVPFVLAIGRGDAVRIGRMDPNACLAEIASLSTWTDSDLRAVCRANDANGDFDDCTRADLVTILTGWIAEEPDYWRALLGGAS